MNPKDYTPRRGKDKEALREYAHKFRMSARAYPGKPVRVLKPMLEKEASPRLRILTWANPRRCREKDIHAPRAIEISF